MRRSLVIAAVLLFLAFVLIGGPSMALSLSSSQQPAAEPTHTTQPTPALVSFDDSKSGFWEYLSPRKGFQKRSPINVIVRGDVADIERVLVEASDGDWSEINESEEPAVPKTYALVGGNASDNETQSITEPPSNDSVATESNTSTYNSSTNSSPDATDNASNGPRSRLPEFNWGEADGGTRYAYVDPGPNESGYWTTETRQLEDGSYYGQRYHIRLYESPNEDDDWVAMQTHSEHFDWFTLRHRVHGSQAAQRTVESNFMAHPQIDVEDDVRRIYLGNSNSSDADGWATVVDLAGLLVVPTLVGIQARRRRSHDSTGADHVTDRLGQRTADALDHHLTAADRRRLAALLARLEGGHFALAFAIIALLLGVRAGGIVLEHRATFLSPHQIAAVLYPVISLGLPTATYLIARGLTRRLDAAVVAAGSLAVAIWLDYGMLGVDTLPLEVVVQRMLVVVALGLLAGGAAKRAARPSRVNDMLLVGIAMWVLVLVGTLSGHF
ncbi:hypothetical protein [Natrinema hispanicum]|uniref:Uncharacterized protein n=1 Tax=Natrinema hispanicum TaxID=392421 RepID=A0A1G6RDI3_9EURY|nr:hypothetical protein [Natrinema hispanicum]SDD02700.1 hypothetical protein SAMN05192552_101127 [Natrinema hispanicum]SET53902.1 hypothetical protein SAMN04488694_10827 [Natrinema hispanicum]